VNPITAFNFILYIFSTKTKEAVRMSIFKFASEPTEPQFTLEGNLPDSRIIEILKKRKITGLRPIQMAAIELGLFFRQNFLICTASGSGKTLIGELAIAYATLNKFGKGIYLVPYKAIAVEKYLMFKNEYGPYGLKIAICSGDSDTEAEELSDASIIVTTYEKLDSILRSATFGGMKWTNSISCVVIDEIHVLGEPARGPRLETLLIRLTERISTLQIIALSATIANPEFFAEWLSTLGKPFSVIKSDYRPIPLQYDIHKCDNKDSELKQLVKKDLEEGGQVMVFLNRRASTILVADRLSELTQKYLDAEDKFRLEKVIQEMKKNPFSSKTLQKIMAKGIGFHNASLDPKDKLTVERAFEQRLIKCIVCTSTLAAGVNTPARHVIVRNFEQYIPNIFLQLEELHYEPEYEVRPGKASVFVPIPNNQLFQILGRAGRPGKDHIGIGTILVSNQDELDWVVQHYFKFDAKSGQLSPKYGMLQSQLNNSDVLKEQMLLLISNYKAITYKKIVEFMKKTYFYFGLKDKTLPVDEFLRIRPITADTLLRLHGNQERIRINHDATVIEIQQMNSEKIEAIVSIRNDAKLVSIDSKSGLNCSCNQAKNNNILKVTKKYNYSFCIHMEQFLDAMRLNAQKDKKFNTYFLSLLNQALKETYVLKFLIDHEFIFYDDKSGLLKATPNGILCTKLFITPNQFLKLKEIFEHRDMDSSEALLAAAFDYIAEEREDDANRLLEALINWINEGTIPEIEKILGLYYGMGDFNQIKQNILRVLSTFDAFSDFFAREEVTAEIKTLHLRLLHGIKPELFDLVVRYKSIDRTIGRMLFNSGIKTEQQLSRLNASELQKLLNVSLEKCQEILQEVSQEGIYFSDVLDLASN
jgi:replicative superfamily II helicase